MERNGTGVNKYISARDMRGEVGEDRGGASDAERWREGGGERQRGSVMREPEMGKTQEEERRKETPESRKEWWEEGWGTLGRETWG